MVTGLSDLPQSRSRRLPPWGWPAPRRPSQSPVRAPSLARSVTHAGPAASHARDSLGSQPIWYPLRPSQGGVKGRLLGRKGP